MFNSRLFYEHHAVSSEMQFLRAVSPLLGIRPWMVISSVSFKSFTEGSIEQILLLYGANRYRESARPCAAPGLVEIRVDR